MTQHLANSPESGDIFAGLEAGLDAPTDKGPGNFDAHHPPDKALIDDCVHCGFCLPTCPTYALWGEEMDSPRGRIYLMDMVREGTASLDEPLVRHFDTCLGCMACVTACPSGVQYDKLLESMRPQIERHHERGRGDRTFRELIFALFPYPRRLRVAALGGLFYQRSGLAGVVRRRRLLDRLPPRLRALEALLPPVKVRDLVASPPERVAAVGTPRRRVAVLTGCVQRVFFTGVNAATVRTLAAEGCEVLIPRDQECCGALSMHSGREPEALERARRTIATFEAHDVDAIVVNVAGCGSTMKEYGTLLRDDPEWADRATAFSAKVRDVTEVLAELEPRAPRHPIQARVAYHDACHLGHAQRVRAAPRAVLRTIPGVEVVDLPEAELCCGSAGVYNLLEPEAASDLGQRKAANVRSVHPDAVATANPGCLLQMRRHLDDPGLPLLHPIELVDASIRGEALPTQK
ncbi:(Fe-S)-binding protein [Actinopolymorpha pittospori]|uniref:Glycolate oxidase iron-sulfur subunit n=1 Tax=Actinopolymorpha pittospori TaxID=648752 RepID=A0A927MYW8_9ACTN|nr:heterodisulfide reductase-related iron-sulfur binding cluster [Actinopolymorpha pittospori]MBE1609501.1 glycolate oxidase iron-sulfur subunit [Actinopolymorpha pittospori]